MHHEDTLPYAQREAEIDRLVLDLLLDEHPHPWTDGEVARELQDRVNTADSINRLHRAGLLHRLDGFVFPSRTASRVVQLAR
jgi:hypothetical protein